MPPLTNSSVLEIEAPTASEIFAQQYLQDLRFGRNR